MSDLKASDIGRKGGQKGGPARAKKLDREQRHLSARHAAIVRWHKDKLGDEGDIPRATHTGRVVVGNVQIPCAVLADETRVISQEGFLKAIGRSPKAKGGQGSSLIGVDDLPPFLAANNLKPFIPKDLPVSTTPVIFQTEGHAYGFGYRAELLPEVCKIFIDAGRAGALRANQQHIAEQCEVALRALATVGVIALVDEATGYQYERDRDALHHILEAYIAKELMPWTRQFPEDFYREMFRLHGWNYEPPQVKKPQVVGYLTNKLVYEQLPPGVLDELKERNPVIDGRRRHKHHQFLSDDIGNPHLGKQIAAVVTLMKASDNWKQFMVLFRRAFKKDRQPQLDLKIN